MAFSTEQGIVSLVYLRLKLSDIPEKVREGRNHKTNGVSAADLEKEAAELIERKFDSEYTNNFVRRVCLWGNYPGVWGKVRDGNEWDSVADALKESFDLSHANDIGASIDRITKVNGLAVSFGSKHLKFLDPTRHVVLDSVISNRLAYKRSREGYCRFVEDCLAVLTDAKKAGIRRADNDDLTVSDIEMAIYRTIVGK